MRKPGSAWPKHSRNGPWTHICCFEVMYLYMGSIFGMWNLVLKRFICMLVVDSDLGIVFICIMMCMLCFVLFCACVCVVFFFPPFLVLCFCFGSSLMVNVS